MPDSKKFWNWVTFMLGMGAYVPILIGGRQHPSEINVAGYGLWIIIAGTVAYSAKARKYPGWKVMAGFLVGNLTVLSLALIQGGYTFNFGPSETIGVYGIVTVLAVWVAMGQIQGKRNVRILYLGMIMVDVISFYPLFKQYLQPHQPPTVWMISGWVMFGLAMFTNLAFVERMFEKLLMSEADHCVSYGDFKHIGKILEESAFSLENFIFICFTVALMLS